MGFKRISLRVSTKRGSRRGGSSSNGSATHERSTRSKKDGVTALRLVSDGNSFGVYREKELNPKKTPILTWQWKVTRLPEGADVRDKKKDDQAAQMYVMFPRFPKMVNTRLVGYIWETSAPKLSKITSRKSSNTRYIVLQSGPENLGKWVTERRNVYEDYKTLFGEEPPEIGGITIMIDSDDTHSSAESYFTDIRLEKKNKPAADRYPLPFARQSSVDRQSGGRISLKEEKARPDYRTSSRNGRLS
ncbi:MAG: DUF3047 domain-containing protein [Candidatus Manganitrophus sp.]|nr:DUF3047 domain-containing protein [Candidatus Manganitrophus sp.]